MEHNRLTEKWSSRMGFIVATAGAAIGLGNIWRFPYMAGTHGGGAFVVVYLICIIVIGIPIMLAEMSIGRRARQDPITALQTLAKTNNHSPKWRFLGLGGGITALLILSFYCVVGGWSIYYLIQDLLGSFNNASPAAITGVWQNLVSSPLQVVLWHTVFMLLTMGVIIAGVVNGIERATKIMMPGLYIILIFLLIYACIVGDAHRAVKFLFEFRWADITTNVVISAMGHAFFSLAVGVGALLIYAAYAPTKSKLVSTVATVATLDVLVAFLSGLAIFPLVFKFHLPINSGPGLMYLALPLSFAKLVGGQWIGLLFFVLLLFAAWTSSINLAEPVIAIVRNWLNCGRSRAALIVGGAAWAVGLLSALSFNVLSNITLDKANLFTLISNLATDILCPLGGLGFCIFAGWFMCRHDNERSLHTSTSVFRIWYWLVRYISPIAIAVIFLSLL